MLVLRHMSENARTLLVALVLVAVALVQVPAVAMASGDSAVSHSAMQGVQDSAPCEHMDAMQADIQDADKADCDADCDMNCDLSCALACMSTATAGIMDISLSAFSASARGFESIASVSGSSALIWSASPPPRL